MRTIRAISFHDIEQNRPLIIVKLTARGARDQLNVAHASPLPWPDGPLRAPPNHGNGADCGAALRERAHA